MRNNKAINREEDVQLMETIHGRKRPDSNFR